MISTHEVDVIKTALPSGRVVVNVCRAALVVVMLPVVTVRRLVLEVSASSSEEVDSAFGEEVDAGRLGDEEMMIEEDTTSVVDVPVSEVVLSVVSTDSVVSGSCSDELDRLVVVRAVVVVGGALVVSSSEVLVVVVGGAGSVLVSV